MAPWLEDTKGENLATGRY